MNHSLDPNIVQRQASDPKASVWVSANAGTGKTKVLTERVLSLMVTGTKAQHILCLTFTKAAAAEMSNRIADQLGKWSVMSEDQLHTTLKDLLQRPATEAEYTLARQLFARVLDAPGGLQILTIHAFCQSLLRRFPLEAGLAPHFQVMDERDAQELLKKAQEEILLDARMGKTPELHDALSIVTAHVHETAFPDLMNALASARGTLRRVLDTHGGVRRLIATLSERMELSPTDTPERILERACEQDSFDALGMRYAAEALHAGSDANKRSSQIISDWLAGTPEERLISIDAYIDIFLANKRTTIRERLIVKKAKEASPGAEDVLSVEAQRMLRLVTKLRGAQTLQATNALLRLGKSLLEAYEKFKQAHAQLDYDDLILMTRELLSPERVPWVLYKLDGGIDHILVDEAQDTNPDQWQVIESLCAEFFVGIDNLDRDMARTVFAVGDVKQSIYSFQGADPAEFDRMKNLFATQVPQGEQIWREVPMTVSFRSTRAVLSCVDAVFADPMVAQGVEIQETVHHDAWRAQDAGLVEVWPTIKAKPGADQPAWKPPVERLQVESPRAELARLMARRIHRMIAGRELLEAKNRPIEPGDVMVLVQRRSGFVEELVRALKELDVAVAGVDRMVLSEQMAVMDLMALGRFVCQPEDDLELACVLKGPLLGLNEDDLFELAYKRKGSLWSTLRDRAKADLRFHQAHGFLADVLAKTDYLRPFELFSYVLSALKGRQKLVARLGVEAHDPLNEFLDLALGFERAHAPSMEEFLAWLQHSETIVKRDLEQDDQNAVRIMTVHGSKGLQAPIVFLPDTVRKPQNRVDLLWPEDPEGEDKLFIWPPKKEFFEEISSREKERRAQKLDEEYRRLLYVALTRAEDRLYICGWETKRAPQEGCWYDLITSGINAISEKITDPFLDEASEMDEAEILRIQSQQTKEAKTSEAPSRRMLEKAALPSWAVKPPKAEPTPSRPLAPSRPEDGEPATRSPLGEDHGYRFKRGNIIHSLLQTLPELPITQREGATQQYLAGVQLGLSEKQQSEIFDETLRLLNDPDFSEIFGPGSQAEVPIVGEVQGRVISAQVDRLLVRDDEVLVIDYKTNRPPPRSVKKIPPVYLKQMQTYGQALQLIYPGRTVRCLLLWTDTPRLMEIPPDLLALK